METFKLITEKGFDWLVGNNGTIKSPAHDTTYIRTRNGKTITINSCWPERIAAQCIHRNGYMEVSTKKNNKRIKAYVHRLVGFAYIDGYEDGLHINHLNGIKTDNRIENLEWCSNSDNVKHAWSTGLVNLCGENHPNAKLTSKRVIYIRKLLNIGIPSHTIAIVADLSHAMVNKIKYGKAWSEDKYYPID
jgi:hypothetical protein